MALLRNGKPVTRLNAGHYKLTVVSRSSTSGFVIERPKTHTVVVSRGAFTGKRSSSVDLTAGTWVFMTTPGKAVSSFVVG